MVGCRQVLLFNFWEVSRMSMVVWNSTGSICKVNSYLSRMGFSSLDDYGRFSAVVWLRSFLGLANLFWLKVLLVPVGVGSLGWSVGACLLWGQFEILYGYVNGALRFKLCRLRWDFYFALLCPNGCFGWCNFYFLNLLDLCLWSCGPFIVLVYSLFEQLVPRVLGFCLCLGRSLQFLNFEERANRANVFPVFPDWL